GKSFECRNNDILNCGCAKIIISGDVRKKISSRYNDCLCVQCLKDFGGIPVEENT
ncbi:MAG: cysteine-rich CWC family protein, partial [Bacteroidales bacterium]|nr:cysteine-rich CWC family protein [Bacteroidales bacterium]